LGKILLFDRLERRRGLGKYRIDFPTAFYLDVINVGAPEELRQLNSRLWEWLGSDELAETVALMGG
jgi:hypothetical protein